MAVLIPATARLSSTLRGFYTRALARLIDLIIVMSLKLHYNKLLIQKTHSFFKMRVTNES
jgi:hypothetical protein